MDKSKVRRRKHSIKQRLIILPLIVVLLAVASIGFVSSLILKSSLLNQMRADGLELANQVAVQLETATSSINTINNIIDKNILSVAQTVILSQDNMSNERLIQIAKDLDVAEINVINKERGVLYSTDSSNVGLPAPTDESHPSYELFNSEKTQIMEDIRKSSDSDEYLKFGYVKSPTGDIIQIGMLANQISDLSARFSYQSIIDELVTNKNIVFALFIDKSLTAVAHSNHDRIGLDLTNDPGARAGVIEKETYASEYFYPAEDVEVYDVIVPVYIDGEHIVQLT